MALGCKPPAIDPGAVRIQARLQPGTPDQYERLELRWSGTWQAPTIIVTEGEYPGRTEADDSLDLDASQTGGLVAFPTATDMRAGLWSFVMLIEGDGETILAEECVAEIFNLKTNLVQFAEGGAGCVCSLGCQPPAS